MTIKKKNYSYEKGYAFQKKKNLKKKIFSWKSFPTKKKKNSMLNCASLFHNLEG